MDALYYVGSPYAHPNPSTVISRYDLVLTFTAELINTYGLVAYSPIVHNHILANRCNIKTGWDTWVKHDLKLLSVSEALVVYTIDGWKTSKGLKHEIKFAEVSNMPIYYVNTAKELIIQITQKSN